MATGPTYMDAMRQGNLARAAGRNEAATDWYRRAVVAAPDAREPRAALADTLLHGWQVDAAVVAFREWVQRCPADPEAHVGLASAHMALGAWDEALTAFEHALGLDPDHGRAATGKAEVLLRTGDAAAAAAVLDPHLKRARNDAHGALVAAVFATVAPKVGREADAVHLLDALLAARDGGGAERPRLLRARANLADRNGEVDAAFAQYHEANAASPPYDMDGFVAWVDAVIAQFDAPGLARMPQASNANRLPVLIVGMPRSGTSLVEQIIAAHPDAVGAGERTDINRMVHQLPTTLEVADAYPACVQDLDRTTLDGLAEGYLAALRRVGPRVRRVTDKMPHNFLHLGFVDRLLPGVRVIHCVRDPLDTALSCYFKQFEGDHGYSNDLGTLGRYYRQYERLMAHWTQVLPRPPLTVRYEELTADPEAGVRRLLDFVGLPWDAGCLAFHRSGRQVRTASYAQVNQPIYRTSVGRWRPYAHHLAPLMAALAEGDWPGAYTAPADGGDG